jgi:hypothetical protein
VDASEQAELDELHSAQESLRRLLVSLVKAALVSNPAIAAPWLDEAVADHAEFRRRYAPALASQMRLDGIWRLAVEAAESDATVRRDEDVNPTLPATCPLGLDELVGPDLDVGAAAHRIREAAAFG